MAEGRERGEEEMSKWMTKGERPSYLSSAAPLRPRPSVEDVDWKIGDSDRCSGA